MKKRLVIIFLLAFYVTGCTKGVKLPEEQNTRNKILLNSTVGLVYTLCDEETGVWYVVSSEGITPRLNSDGTLYSE